VALRKMGANWVGLCPFHGERTPSFNVRESTGRYKCFGCGVAGDVFTFIQEIEHVDFVTAVEQLAAKAGLQLNYTSGGESRERQRRKQLVEAVRSAVDWYHERLLTSPDAREARDYLRRRGLAGDVARNFKLGWAPDDWDVMSQQLGVGGDLLRDTGLAFTNKANRLQDAFRGRVMFPIYTENGDPVAFGGRILPGSPDPAKYKNSSETPIYAKSKTLYGLNWAKADIVSSDQVIVCEGYTDVIGFHRAGLRRAVATCGTALTEEHVRMMKRFASKVVLAFDADKAGQGAAERFYEWEEKYQVQVSVAQFPDGKDPGDLSLSDPAALRDAIDHAVPFLGFRLQRVWGTHPLRTPEDKARAAKDAMIVVNEHPSLDVRKLYAGEVALRVGLAVPDLVAVAQRGGTPREFSVPQRRRVGLADNAEFIAVAMLLQRWNDVASWLIEGLFSDDVARRAFLALADTNGVLSAALEAADPEARELLERAAVADFDAEPFVEACNLIAAAVRRELARSTDVTDADSIRANSEARRSLELLDEPTTAQDAAGLLLGWLERHGEERE
ncbi:MAG: dnaG, partial [Ilumatobacteraceae bacterium]|nr:dnaG [Ilumatobacteraceae bacterium]